MPAVPRRTDQPMDWEDFDGDMISIDLESDMVVNIAMNYDSAFRLTINKDEVEDFLEWFNNEVRRVYGIE